MADGRYIFRYCVPDGNIDIANVQTGDVINRAWNWRVNMPPDLQQELLSNGGVFDPRAILRGYDGRLYDGDGNWLAEVNTWHAQISVTNSDYQAAGNKIVWALMQSYTVTLTFTETVIRDAILLKKLIDGLRNDAPDVIFNFSGVLRGH